ALGGLTGAGFGDADSHRAVGAGHHVAAGERNEYRAFQLRRVRAPGTLFIGVIAPIRPVVDQDRGDTVADEGGMVGRAVVFFDVVIKLIARALRIENREQIAVGNAPILNFFAVGIADVLEELLGYFVD